MDRRLTLKALALGATAVTSTNIFISRAEAQAPAKTKKFSGDPVQPVFFAHVYGDNKEKPQIEKSYTTDSEIIEWEKLMLENVGIKVDGKAIILGGGCCCGGGGGMCDVD